MTSAHAALWPTRGHLSIFSFRIQTSPDLPQNAHYRAAEAAKLLNCSERQLRRCCVRVFGCSAQEWLDEQRLKVAANLLKEQRCVKTVALDLGFKQASHFSRRFKLYYGLSPSKFMSAMDNKWPSQTTH